MMAGAHVCSYLSAAAARCDGRPLFSCGERSATATQVAARVAALAVGLAHRLGAQAGNCVCLAALATDHNVEALLATTAAGCVAAPLNWRWSAAEGGHALRLVDAQLLFADAACLGFAAAASAAAGAGAVRALVLLGDPAEYAGVDLGALPAQAVFAEHLIASCPTPTPLLRYAPDGAALVVFTSGTTGKAKGVVLSHAALHAQSMAKLLMVGYCGTDVYLHAAPLFHIGGLSSALAMLLAGSRHIFLPRFAPADFLGAVAQHGVTSFIAVPAMVAALVDAAAGVSSGSGSQGPPVRLDSVRTILLGGGGTGPALQAGLRALCPRASVQTAYGMTEAASSMTFLNLWTAPGAHDSRSPGSAGSSNSSGASGGLSREQEEDAAPAGGVFVGAPPPGIELAVFHPPQGALSSTSPARSAGGVASAAAAPAAGAYSSGGSWGRVAQQGEGEIVTRGPHVMLGYWKDEAASRAAFLPGGWMRTGDLGFMHNGRLWLMGRAKDMIKSGGENVHAWEVERALCSHPAIAAAAVVGVPDWRLGEAVAAALELRDGWQWRGARCQALLLARGRAVRAAVAAAAAGGASAAPPRGAEAAVAAAAAAADAGSAGAGSREAALDAVAGDDEAADGSLAELKLQAAGGRDGSPPRYRASLAAALGAVEAGLHSGPLSRQPDLAAQQHQHQQLQRLVAGLLQLSALGDSSAAEPGHSPSGDREGMGGASGSGSGSQWVDGLALQQHCRRAGLAGFKLPRVFLVLPGSEALPANSTGKVLKHMVRERVEREAQAAGEAAGEVPVARARL